MNRKDLSLYIKKRRAIWLRCTVFWCRTIISQEEAEDILQEVICILYEKPGVEKLIRINEYAMQQRNKVGLLRVQDNTSQLHIQKCPLLPAIPQNFQKRKLGKQPIGKTRDRRVRRQRHPG